MPSYMERGREQPPNNRMQLTGSARCEGGYTPPPQLIRELGRHRRVIEAWGDLTPR